MKKLRKCMKGTISVMLAILLSGVLSLALLLVEGGRLQLARQELDDATLTSALSMLAGYNTDLQKRFGLYGINEESKKSASSFNTYMLFNSNNSADPKYNINDISKMYTLCDSSVEYMYDLANYQVLKRQILEYSKYRAPIDMAEELFDIDKAIDKLVKNIEQLIPGLDNMLKILDSVADIWSAIKEIYKLEKNIEVLQLSIGTADSEDWSENLKIAFGKGWAEVDKFLTGESWDICVPTYVEAYNNLVAAIDEKTNYMKSHPEPEKPVQPTSNLDDAASNYNMLSESYKPVQVLYDLLSGAKELGYCGSNGIVDKDEKIQDLIKYIDGLDHNYFETYSFSLNEQTSRESFFSKINDQLRILIGSDHAMPNNTIENLETAIDTVKDVRDNLYNQWVTARETYIRVNAEWTEYYQKNAAYNEYQEKIQSCNNNIEAKKQTLQQTIQKIMSALGKYRSSIQGIVSALQKAVSACDEIIENANQIQRIQEANEENKDRNPWDPIKEAMTPEEFEEFQNANKSAEAVGDAFKKLIEMIESAELSKPDEGIQELQRQLNYLAALNAADIAADYRFDMGKGKIEVDGGYFMSKTQSLLFINTVTGLQVIQQFTYLSQMFDSLKKIVKAFKPFNETFDPECSVFLNDVTSGILPSKLNGGNGSSGGGNASDASNLAIKLEEARSVVGIEYATDIDNVDPDIRNEEALLNSSLMEAIDRLEQNLSSLLFNDNNDNTICDLLQPGSNLILVIIALIGKVDTLRQIILDLKYVFSNIKAAIQIVISSLGDNLLLNYYATSMFPNRLNDISGATTQGRNYDIYNSMDPSNVDPYNPHSLYQDPYASYNAAQEGTNQTFAAAQVEYILYGSRSEIENQRRAYWTIMVLRLINNAVCVLADSTAAHLIAACNVLAPVAYIIWVVYESIIDMNLLLDVGQKIPLIKTGIILSPNTLMTSVDQLIKDFETYGSSMETGDKSSGAEGKATAEEHLKGLIDEKGFCKLDYRGYLTLFLFFVSNKVKTLRMADLIQMEMRYKQQISGKTVNFLMEEADTYVRGYGFATYNSFLPIFSFTNAGGNSTGWKFQSIKYVGY